MTRKYIYGSPIETEAVVVDIEREKGELPYFEINQSLNQITYSLGEKDVVYGLGQQNRGINKRGWKYVSFCTDDPVHTEDKISLYGAHNFLIIDGEKKLGVFFDTPEEITFDIGYTSSDKLVITLSSWNFSCYVIEEPETALIVKEFRKLIGQSYIPPKWAFGYGQSRWSYNTDEEVRAVVEQHEKLDIPLDSVYLDIDYMERYKDFSIDKTAFPDFKGLVEEMKEKKIHLIPIIDAGVKIEEGYDVYEEGVKHDYFCKNEKGENFVVGVWPGKVYLPDMLKDEAREWFGEKYKFLLDFGIDGFWNDMNEPALFYAQDHLDEVFKKVKEYEGQNLDIHTYFSLMDMLKKVNNRKEDYERFYHEYKGSTVRHDKVHNLYGYYMTRSAGEAFDRLEPEKRILLFSRASYIGMHRYGGIWTGDNCSWWSHLLLNIKMMPSLNMCGFLYTGADLGGFGSNVTPDLLLRWLEFGIFTPLMRNHSAAGTRRQELYEYEGIEDYKNILKLRYMLLPYIYSEYVKAALNNEMYMKPIAFVYPEDSRAREVEDQLFVGDSLMIAPVYQQNAKGRYVYLPEEMKLYRMSGPESIETEILPAGDHYVKAELNEVLLFIPKNHILPIAEPKNRAVDIDSKNLKLLGFAVDGAEYNLYDDDGYTKDYNQDKNTTKISVNEKGEISVDGGRLQVQWK